VRVQHSEVCKQCRGAVAEGGKRGSGRGSKRQVGVQWVAGGRSMWRVQCRGSSQPPPLPFLPPSPPLFERRQDAFSRRCDAATRRCRELPLCCAFA